MIEDLKKHQSIMENAIATKYKQKQKKKNKMHFRDDNSSSDTSIGKTRKITTENKVLKESLEASNQAFNVKSEQLSNSRHTIEVLQQNLAKSYTEMEEIKNNKVSELSFFEKKYFCFF